MVCDEESLRYATIAVLQDFSDDGVCYVELRTTPRAISTAGITKDGYVSIVLEAMNDFTASQQNKLHGDATAKEQKLHAKLILSIDRKNSLDEALEVVVLAAQYRDQGVVGIDLCGNPTRKPISHLSPAFAEAKRLGLGITVHFAETPQDDAEELEMMLEWQPQRLGHAIHIPTHLKRIIAERKLGLELCLSCNVLCKLSRGGFEAHHFGEWWEDGAKIALSTDDVGIFESSLSEEYALAAKHFGLSRKQLWDLGRGAVNLIFGGEKEKERVWRVIDRFWDEEGRGLRD